MSVVGTAKAACHTSVYAIHVTISKAFGDAVDWGLPAVKPAATAKAVPRPAETEMQVWSGEQLRTFLVSGRDDRLFAMWLLLITTGLRRDEVAGVRWSDLDLDAGRLTVAQTRVSVDYTVTVGTPKTDKSRHTIGLDPATVAGLRTYRPRRAEERLAWVDEGLVFVREDRSAFHPDRIRKMFHARAKTAGLPPIRVHDLRHSLRDRRPRGRRALKVVSDRLGHGSIAITGDLREVDARATDNVARFILGS